ncbi:MAG: C25 family cysteine peptidase [candidate division WOR-3 bacterium]
MIFILLLNLEIKITYRPLVKAETLENIIRFSGKRVEKFEPGLPDLPSYLVPIEVNPEFEYEVDYRIISEEIIKGNYEIERVKEIKEDGLSLKELKKDYKIPFPDNIILNKGLSFIRYKPILSIILFPVRIKEEGIEIIKEIEIILKEKVKSKLKTREIPEDKKIKDFYKKVLFKTTEKEFLPLQSKINNFFEKTNLWLKIIINQNGIYYLTYEDIKNNLNISPENLDIKKIAIFTRLKALSDSPDSAEITPQKVPFLFIDRGEENIFDEKDTLFFFAFTGTGYRVNNGKIEYYFNPYQDASIYFISFEGDSGKFMESIDGSPLYNLKIEKGISVTRHENNFINLARAGLRWVGETLKNDSLIFNLLKFKNPLPETANLKFSLVIRERESINQPPYLLKLFMNNNVIFQKNYYPPSAPYGEEIKLKTLLNLNPLFKVKIQGTINVDYLELKYNSELKNLKDNFEFYFPPTNEKDISFNGTFRKKGKLFKILNPYNGYNITNFSFTNNSIIFNPGIENDTFMIMYSETPFHPLIKKFEETELRKISGADMLIIAPKEFKNIFSKFILHRKENFYIDTLKIVNPVIEFVNINDIFEEFGFGIKDPVAIRNYLKYTYINYNPRPFYVLLAGKGTYDYKNYEGSASLNLVPPYEWGYGVDINNPPYTYDNFFVEFDGGAFDPDMVIGRIPAKSSSELYEFLERIIFYETGNFESMFKNTVIGVADDTTGASGNFDPINHTTQVTRVLNKLKNSIDKIAFYMIDYPFVQGRKPSATKDLLKYIEKGAGFFFFFIHGNPNQLAHEELLKLDDIDFISYNKKPSFIILGSCKTMNFDRPSGAIGEKWLMKNGIGALGSTYLTFPSENEYVIDNFFNKLSDYKKHTFGFISYLVTMGNKDYVFLGDPSTFYSLPPKSGTFLYIPDTIHFSYFSDTLFKFYGESDSLKVRFTENSEISIMKIEGTAKIESLYVHNNILYPLYRKGKLLFQGISRNKNLESKFYFAIPYINSNLLKVTVLNTSPQGEISYRDSIPAKISKKEKVDLNAPEIKISVNGRELKDWDTLPPNFSLFIEINDESGINLAADTITLRIGSFKEALNDFFYYKPNSFNEGFINYQVKNLPSGKTILTLSAYDLFHNRKSLSRNIFIETESTSELKISDIIPYPNPASDFVFIGFKNNKRGVFKLKIYTMRGVKIFETEELFFSEGFNSIKWKIDEKLTNGLYLFVLEAREIEGGKKIRKRGKIIVFR